MPLHHHHVLYDIISMYVLFEKWNIFFCCEWCERCIGFESPIRKQKNTNMSWTELFSLNNEWHRTDQKMPKYFPADRVFLRVGCISLRAIRLALAHIVCNGPVCRLFVVAISRQRIEYNFCVQFYFLSVSLISSGSILCFFPLFS